MVSQNVLVVILFPVAAVEDGHNQPRAPYVRTSTRMLFHTQLRTRPPQKHPSELRRYLAIHFVLYRHGLKSSPASTSRLIPCSTQGLPFPASLARNDLPLSFIEFRLSSLLAELVSGRIFGDEKHKAAAHDLVVDLASHHPVRMAPRNLCFRCASLWLAQTQ